MYFAVFLLGTFAGSYNLPGFLAAGKKKNNNNKHEK